MTEQVNNNNNKNKGPKAAEQVSMYHHTGNFAIHGPAHEQHEALTGQHMAIKQLTHRHQWAYTWPPMSQHCHNRPNSSQHTVTKRTTMPPANG